MSAVRFGSVTVEPRSTSSGTATSNVPFARTRSSGLLHWVNKQTGVAICGRRVSGKPIEAPNDRIRMIGERGICPTCNVDYLEMGII